MPFLVTNKIYFRLVEVDQKGSPKAQALLPVDAKIKAVVNLSSTYQTSLQMISEHIVYRTARNNATYQRNVRIEANIK